METLLSLLEKNARLSTAELGAMLEKSPEEIEQMMELAKEKGYLRGYRALVDWARVNGGADHVQAMIELKVSPKKNRGFDESASTIAAFDEVQNLLLMSGGFDLMLIITGKSFQEVAQFVAMRLAPLDDVLSTATHFVLRTYKKDGALYEDEEADERECTVQ